MSLIVLYSILLVFGIIVSQSLDLSKVSGALALATGVCLSYIMIEVGLEFVLDKKRLKSYGRDFFYAFLAAALPWILCSVYLIMAFRIEWPAAFLVGVFAAPTSAGVLLAMLAAGGLSATWVFQKVRVLAVFDDIAAILLLVSLQVIFIGVKPQLGVTALLIGAILWLAYAKLHSFSLPVGKDWLFLYGIIITVVLHFLHDMAKVEIGVVLPAFVAGVVLINKHDPTDSTHKESPDTGAMWLDRFIKAAFMFLVGCSLPKIDMAGIGVGTLVAHVLALTVLSNLGKCFLFFCYRDEVSTKTRLALSVAMFPRGEVGAGVLLMAIGYGLKGMLIALPVLSLALNLVLTGVFISVVVGLVNSETDKKGILHGSR